MQAIVRKAKSEGIHVVELDGISVQSLEGYIAAIESGFRFPYEVAMDFINPGDLKVMDWKGLTDGLDSGLLVFDEEERKMAVYHRLVKAIQYLSWLDCEGHALVIYDYSEFMKTNFSLRELIIKDFANIILTEWHNDRFIMDWQTRNDCMPDFWFGYAKPFHLYLVD